jgi:hypothetical protein
MIFVSFFTSKYTEEAHRLIASLSKQNLKFEVDAIKDYGSWQQNTQYKAKFLLKKQEKHGKVCWLDADCEVKKYPELLLNINEDVAFHRFRGSELLSGTLFFNDSDAANLLIREWIKVNQENPDKWDQKNLDEAIKRSPFVTIKELPPEYCLIFDLGRRVYKDVDPVIEHFQASRKYR